MVSESVGSARAGRPKALSHRQILDAAAEIADTDGLDAVSFRVLAERLGISPMSVHRTTSGIDALRRDLISTLVGEAVSSIDWPTDWRGVAHTFAYGLHDLLMRHPLVLEAHRQASLEAPGADDTAHRVVRALSQAGLDDEQATYAYGAVHDFVTGHVAIQLGRGAFDNAPADRREASVFALHHDPARRFEFGVTLILDGVASIAQRGSTK
ncbi:TetR/AcrR family transcriptional regulator [Rhodococcus erythropolis]|uniref:TetR/AcrR family transcriptional regulator n=1 Tax=Rhodococcus erythropolis TaxID=1833 RepID=UPI00038E5F8E|nr:TetR/AcrR family transcriptional regulator C-terminal domain-containing protein [Rhodococcus erythropolis]EQM32364.1 TetR family transcriptional regulator [Rhodococcus erythropolis DN1]